MEDATKAAAAFFDATAARYRERGIIWIDSPSCGAWEWPGGVQGEGVCERDRRRRYWHHRMLPQGATDGQ